MGDKSAILAAMDEANIRRLLETVASGQTPVDQAVQALRALPYEELGFAVLDNHRALRWGFPEVVYCPGKTAEQVAQIVAQLAARSAQVLGTRASQEQFEAARAVVPDLRYSNIARAIWLDRQPARPRQAGVVIAAAGTSDLPVAEEAALTLDLMGHAPERIYDVGVSGLHRLLPHLATLQAAKVVVVVAGMEGALASVVGGLVAAPVIAVPTSVGYGASFGGLAALLTMLNSCAAGVGVVNIDNGFGAGFLAARINAGMAGW
jgi:hypothetical protein